MQIQFFFLDDGFVLGMVYGMLFNQQVIVQCLLLQFDSVFYKVVLCVFVFYLKLCNIWVCDGVVVVVLVDFGEVCVDVSIGLVIGCSVMCVSEVMVLDYVVGWLIVSDFMLLYENYYCFVICQCCCDGFCLLGMLVCGVGFDV